MVQGGLTLMLAGWLGYQLRELPHRVMSAVRAWTTREIQVRDRNPMYDTWLSYLTEHAVRPGGPRALEVRRSPDDSAPHQPRSKLAAGTSEFWARINRRWCRVHVHREHGTANQAELASRCMITLEVFLARRRDIERMNEEVALRADTGRTHQLVDIFDRWGSATTLTLPKRHARTLCLPNGLFDSIESRLREFCRARDQYESCGLPWRFGVLLSGPPGTGKTSLAHALASHLGVRISVLNLSDLENDQDLVTVFRAITGCSIVLIEDIDCAFSERRAQSANGISFSGFLNCIDGVLAPNNGRILVMSTNHPERLDPALVRPGRVDLSISVPTLASAEAREYVDRIFADVPERHEIVEAVLQSEQPTPAVLINRLTQRRWQPPARADRPPMMRHRRAPPFGVAP